MIKHFFVLSAITLTLLSCSKEEGEGGRSSISGTITGTEITTARAEITEITAVPGHEIKSQDFFFLNTPNGAPNYAIWFRDINNLMGNPNIDTTFNKLIRIDFSSSGSNNVDIAVSLEAAINAITGTPFTVSRTNDFLTITNTSANYVNDADNAISKFIIDVATQGRPQMTLQSGAFADEDVYIIYGDEDEIYDDNIKTNFDGTFKFTNLRKGTYKVFAYSEDESVVSGPLTPVFEEIEISGNEDADIGTITIEKKMNLELNSALNQLTPISLKELDRVKLQDRTDTKFVFNADLLPTILNEISAYYSILEIDGKRTNSYRTLYYDTKDLRSYIKHHNGKANRIKVRFRKYIESDLNFLEVKYKNNKGRTIKARTKTALIETKLTDFSEKFIVDNSYSFFEGQKVLPVLWNNFTRLTLAHKTLNERLTIDLNLGFESFENHIIKNIDHIIIAEVKQEKASLNSDFIRVIRKHHIRKSSMSKYCVGTALLNKNLKQNNFKERILKINKLKTC